MPRRSDDGRLDAGVVRRQVRDERVDELLVRCVAPQHGQALGRGRPRRPHERVDGLGDGLARTRPRRRARRAGPAPPAPPSSPATSVPRRPGPATRRRRAARRPRPASRRPRPGRTAPSRPRAPVPGRRTTRAAPVSVTARSRCSDRTGASGQRTTTTAPEAAYQAARSGAAVQTTTPHRSRPSARPCSADPPACAPARSRTRTCSRRPSAAAAIAAVGWSVWTCTCHQPSPPTTATESPSPPMRRRSSAPVSTTAPSPAPSSLTSSMTSYAPPVGSTDSRCAAAVGQPVERDEHRPLVADRAGQRVEDDQQGAGAGVQHARGAEHGVHGADPPERAQRLRDRLPRASSAGPRPRPPRSTPRRRRRRPA